MKDLYYPSPETVSYELHMIYEARLLRQIPRKAAVVVIFGTAAVTLSWPTALLFGLATLAVLSIALQTPTLVRLKGTNLASWNASFRYGTRWIFAGMCTVVIAIRTLSVGWDGWWMLAIVLVIDVIATLQVRNSDTRTHPPLPPKWSGDKDKISLMAYTPGELKTLTPYLQNTIAKFGNPRGSKATRRFAIAELQDQVDRSQGPWIVHYTLMDLHLDLYEISQALTHAQVCMRLAPKDPRSPYGLASIYYRLVTGLTMLRQQPPSAEAAQAARTYQEAIDQDHVTLPMGDGVERVAEEAARLGLTQETAASAAAHYFEMTLQLDLRSNEVLGVQGLLQLLYRQFPHLGKQSDPTLEVMPMQTADGVLALYVPFGASILANRPGDLVCGFHGATLLFVRWSQCGPMYPVDFKLEDFKFSLDRIVAEHNSKLIAIERVERTEIQSLPANFAEVTAVLDGHITRDLEYIVRLGNYEVGVSYICQGTEKLSDVQRGLLNTIANSIYVNQ